jgi:iron complex transport system ATP-binding protein
MGMGMDNISFSYPGHPVLHNVSCCFETGRFHAVLGPNGSGKTTLLDILSGFTAPDTGSLQLNGTRATRFSKREAARTMALVSQDYEIRFPFTVEEVVLMGRHPYIDRFSRPSATDVAKAEEAMALTGILHLKHNRITEISGGEKQRSVFARALCQDTPFLLLDEAFANMDIHHTIQLLSVLKQHTDSGAKTVIAVLHDLNQAAAWADTLLLLKDGRVLEHGDTASVFTESNIKTVFNVEARVRFSRFTSSLQAAFKV